MGGGGGNMISVAILTRRSLISYVGLYLDLMGRGERGRGGL